MEINGNIALYYEKFSACAGAGDAAARVCEILESSTGLLFFLFDYLGNSKLQERDEADELRRSISADIQLLLENEPQLLAETSDSAPGHVSFRAIREGQLYHFFPIVQMQKRYGFLVTLESIADNRVLTDGHLPIILCASSFIAIELLHEQRVLEVTNKIRGHFVLDLVRGNYLSDEEIIYRANSLDISLRYSHRILFIYFDRQDGRHATKNEQAVLTDDVIVMLRKLFLLRCKQCLLVAEQSGILIMSALMQYDVFGSRISFGKWIENELTSVFPGYDFYIGIGRRCLMLPDYRFSCNEAMKAVEIARELHRTGATTFASLGSYALLYNLNERDQLREFGRSKLSALVEDDRKHQGNLVDTLECYFNENTSLTTASRKLHLSENGLRYRLGKIARLTNMNLSNSNDQFDLQLALHIFRLFGKR